MCVIYVFSHGLAQNLVGYAKHILQLWELNYALHSQLYSFFSFLKTLTVFWPFNSLSSIGVDDTIEV